MKTKHLQDTPIATVEGWEDGQKFSRPLYKLDRWELQSADRLTLHIGPHHVVLVQDPHSNHLGGYVWLTAIVFCAYLESLTKRTRHDWISLDRTKRWVELGSGVGLIGIMLRQLGIESVMVTDIEALVPVMEKNVEANGYSVRSVSGRRKNEADKDSDMLVEPLLWGNEEDMRHVKSLGPIDYLVACDCIYSEASALDLVRTMHCLASDTTCILCISEVRNQAAQDAFVAEAKLHFHMEVLPASTWQGKVKGLAYDETLNFYRLRRSVRTARAKAKKEAA
ncbi:putative methyltransferase-domain-containing protein [Spinellus fusiger]|nr:putative methyltransferase-domain-containing protein [Spinellus fusiger]